MRRQREETWLVWLLRLCGGFTLLAFFAMFLPTEWMAATHRWLGLGEFPASPVVDYLTRSIAGLYAIHGGILLVIARDVRAHATLIAYLGAASVLFGIGLVVIDWRADLPLWWVAGEGPPLLLVGLLILWLIRRVPRGPGP
jgi:hypothetical protein